MFPIGASARSCAALARSTRLNSSLRSAVAASSSSLTHSYTTSSSSPRVPNAVNNASSFHQKRHSSHSPMGTQSGPPRKKVTMSTIKSLYQKGEPIAMITAHDFPSAYVADQNGMDIVLVGDSLAMVALGMEDTNEVEVEDMLLHCRSVARAAKSSFTVSFCFFLFSISHRLTQLDRSGTFPWAPMKSPLNKP